jgi:hypothetical protein
VNGKVIDNVEITHGYAILRRRWKSGDLVQLSLDMPVQQITANPNVAADKGRAALQRGPIVYCFEGTDNGTAVQNLIIPPGAEFMPEFRSNLLGGVAILSGNATALLKDRSNPATQLPMKVTAIPYFANANRGTCPMQVWMSQNNDAAKAQNQE